MLAATAALAEAAADTAAGECGTALKSVAYMITSGRRVPAGSDGGITLAGTLAGIIAAVLISVISAAVEMISWRAVFVAASAAILGLLFDSLLGATLQRRGWVSNSGVNLFSTIFSAAIAIAAVLLIA